MQLRSFLPTGCHERCLPINHNSAPRLLYHCEAKLRSQIEVFVVIERREDRFESEADTRRRGSGGQCDGAGRDDSSFD